MVQSGKPTVAAARSILRAYAELRGFDAALGDFEAELEALPGKYVPPDGCFLLATWEGEAVGCVAFRKLDEEICEMKRLFVLPAYGGKGIGGTLVAAIIGEARKMGYQKMRLDTHPWMVHAQKLYSRFGFYEIGAYNDNPTPGIRFFEKEL